MLSAIFSEHVHNVREGKVYRGVCPSVHSGRMVTSSWLPVQPGPVRGMVGYGHLVRLPLPLS